MITIGYKRRGDRKTREVSFSGTSAYTQGMQFIYNMQPCHIDFVREEHNEAAKGFRTSAETRSGFGQSPTSEGSRSDE